jgi:arginyl-tRNA--protein-N-Asp/Glu arginylyltransferase
MNHCQILNTDSTPWIIAVFWLFTRLTCQYECQWVRMICREKEVVMKHLKKLSLVFIIILKCPNYGRWRVVRYVHVKACCLCRHVQVMEPEYEPSKRQQLCISRQKTDGRYVPTADSHNSFDRCTKLLDTEQKASLLTVTTSTSDKLWSSW